MVKVGDIIQLRDSNFHGEFINGASWSDKYLYEDQFKYVSLKFNKMGQNGDMAKTIFGSSQSRVITIEYIQDKDPFIVTTDFLRIIFPEALKNKEISFFNIGEINFTPLESEKELVENLEFFEQKYLNGFSVLWKGKTISMTCINWAITVCNKKESGGTPSDRKNILN